MHFIVSCNCLFEPNHFTLEFQQCSSGQLAYLTLDKGWRLILEAPPWTIVYQCSTVASAGYYVLDAKTVSLLVGNCSVETVVEYSNGCFPS
jgi:hypothetical protein